MAFNILNLSGGGTRIVGIYTVARTLINNGYRPNVISGVSAGSYLALPLALGYFEKIDLLVNSLTLDNMFNVKPVDLKGNITLASIWRIIKGQYWIGDQTKSLELVKAAVSSGDFEEWKYNENADSSVYQGPYPDCFVSTVDFRSGSKELINLRECSYENALNFILGSGSIPFFTKGVDIQYGGQQNLFFDGGLRNHIASVSTLNKFLREGKKIDHSISVFARPEDYRIPEAPTWMPSDVSTVIQRSLDIMGIEISKKDEEMEKLICSQNSIRLNQVFLPDILEGTYDVNKERLKKYSEEAYKIANEIVI